MANQIETQFTAKLKEGLQKKQAAQFDQTFMGLQVLGHMRMVEALDVMQQQASGEFQQTLQQALDTTRQHLAKAEQINQTLEKTSVAARPDVTEEE
jgi:hypothetical protein